MSCNISVGTYGLPFSIDGTVVWFCLTETQIRQILCHGLSAHGVGVDGGFYGGTNSEVRGRGVAIGVDAKVMPLHRRESINAIQLGKGTNNQNGTFQVFDWLLLDKYGIIPKERLPEFDPDTIIIDAKSVERKSKVVTQQVSVINPDYEKFLADTSSNHVDMVLPKASEVEGLGFYFRLFKQGVDEFALKVERSHSDIIKVGKSSVDGGYEEWIGVTCDKAGVWFYLVASGGSYYLMSESNVSDLSDIV